MDSSGSQEKTEYKRVVVREINMLSDSNIGLIKEPLIHICDDPKYEDNASELERPEPTAEQLSNDPRPILQDGVFCKPISHEQLEKDKQLIVSITKKNIEAYEEFMRCFSSAQSSELKWDHESVLEKSSDCKAHDDGTVNEENGLKESLIVYEGEETPKSSVDSDAYQYLSLLEPTILKGSRHQSFSMNRNSYNKAAEKLAAETSFACDIQEKAGCDIKRENRRNDTCIQTSDCCGTSNQSKKIVELVENITTKTTTTTTKTVKTVRNQDCGGCVDGLALINWGEKETGERDDVDLDRICGEQKCLCDFCVRHRKNPIVTPESSRNKPKSLEIEE